MTFMGMTSLYFLCNQPAIAQVTLKVAASNFPPYFIYHEEKDGIQLSGFEKDLDEEIARRLGIKIEFVLCPWARCVNMLKEGQIDIVGALRKTIKRKKFLSFIEPPYQTFDPMRHVYFYVRSGEKNIIRNLGDLAKENQLIGVIRGDEYFPELDQLEQKYKYVVGSTEAAFDLLLKNKIDAVALIETPPSWIASQYGDGVMSAHYFHQTKVLFHKAFSLQGKALPYTNQVSLILSQLHQEGFFAKLRTKYQDLSD